MPSSLRPSLSPLQSRLRLVRATRTVACGIIALAVSAPATFAIGLLLDADVPYLRTANAIALAAIAGFAAMALRHVRRSDSAHDLALLAERRWPELGERLVTAVDAEEAGRWNGDPTWGESLRREAEQALQGRDVRSACDVRPARRLAIRAAAILAAAAFPLIFFPSYARFAQRLALAWTDRVYGFDLEVQPGDRAAARGQNIVIAARIVPQDDQAPLPRFAELHVDGSSKVHRLEFDGDKTFALPWTLKDDAMTYRIRAGSRTAGPFRLRAVDPAKLAEGGTDVRIVPPRYVPAETQPATQWTDPTSFAALQYSQASWRFRFDRPAAAARIRHRFGGTTAIVELPIDGKEATWKHVAHPPGHHEAELETEVEDGVVWRTPLATWSVWADGPPTFSEPLTDGSASAERTVQPGDRLRLRFSVEDAVGIERAELEWRIGEGPTRSMPLHSGKGIPRVARDFLFPLDSAAKAGGRLYLRVRAFDGRRMAAGEAGPKLPADDLGPQSAADPADDDQGTRWLEYRIEPKAEPRHRQIILAERDSIAKELEAIRQELERERKDLHEVRPMFHQALGLSPEIVRRLGAVGAKNSEVQEKLHRLGVKLIGTPGLASLGRLTQDVARRELAASEAAIAKAGAKEAPPAMRERETDQADDEVRKAIARLEELGKVNAVLAQARLDQENLERLAMREEDLAAKAEAEKLTAEEAKNLMDEQAQLAEELDRIARESPLGKEIAAKLQQARGAELAKQAQGLAMKQRKEAKESADRVEKKVRDVLGAFAERQAQLAQKTAAAEKELRTILPTATLPTASASEAAERLRQAKIEPALADQRRTETELLAKAKELEQNVDLATSPREQAKRLLERQRKIIENLEGIGEDFPRLKKDDLTRRLSEVEASQRALGDAVGKLEPVPNAKGIHAKAEAAVKQAADQMAKKDAFEAHQMMEAARDALAELAAALPEGAPRDPAKESADQKALRGQGSRLAELAKEQKTLHYEILKAIAEAMKEGTGSGDGLAKESEKLAKSLMEFSQKAEGPEAKRLGQEAASAADKAMKAMEASKKEAEQAKLDAAMKAGEEAALQFEMAAQKAEAAAASMKTAPGAEEKSDVGEAIAESKAKMQAAMTPGKPDASRLKQAALSLQKAAKSLGDQTARRYPPPASAPAGSVPDLPDAWKDLAGKTWGDLPGELRTRLVEDLRTRYGDDYGPIIQRYFRNIAAAPQPKRP